MGIQLGEGAPLAWACRRVGRGGPWAAFTCPGVEGAGSGPETMDFPSQGQGCVYLWLPALSHPSWQFLALGAQKLSGASGTSQGRGRAWRRRVGTQKGGESSLGPHAAANISQGCGLLLRRAWAKPRGPWCLRLRVCCTGPPGSAWRLHTTCFCPLGAQGIWGWGPVSPEAKPAWSPHPWDPGFWLSPNTRKEGGSSDHVGIACPLPEGPERLCWSLG